MPSRPSSDPQGHDSVPLVSVIIPVYNDAVRLRTCLAALGRQTLGQHAFEVIVVDNGSSDGSGMVAGEFPFARLLHEAAPGSYAARNAGLDSVKADVIAFTDSDCVPEEDWLSQALRALEDNPDVDAVGGKVCLIECERPTSAELFEQATAFQQERHIVEEGFAVTANLIARTSTVRKVGKFDPRLMSNGDIDWGKRLTAMGLSLRYAPDVVVFHPARKTLRALVTRRRRLEGGVFSRAKTRVVRGDRRSRPVVGAHGVRKAVLMWRDPGSFGFSRLDVIRVFFVTLILECCGILERIRLKVGGKATRA